MDCVCIGQFGGGDDVVHISITRLARRWTDTHILVSKQHVQCMRVGLRVHGDGSDAQIFAGANDAQGDLAPVGDQDLLEQDRTSDRADAEQSLTVFHGATTVDIGFYHFAIYVGLDLVHDFHGLDNTDGLPHLDPISDVDERFRLR